MEGNSPYSQERVESSKLTDSHREDFCFQASRQPALQQEVNLLAASTDEGTEALGVCQVRVHKSPPPTATDEVMCYRECRSEVASITHGSQLSTDNFLLSITRTHFQMKRRNEARRKAKAKQGVFILTTNCAISSYADLLCSHCTGALKKVTEGCPPSLINPLCHCF